MKLIYLLFGKPERESKRLFITYWFFVCVYFFGLLFLFIGREWFSALFSALTFPIIFRIIFRIVYRANSKVHRKLGERSLKAPFIVLGIVGVVIAGGIWTMLLFSEDSSVAMNIKHESTEDYTRVAIGSLKGEYEVLTFEIKKGSNGILSIPYHSTIGDGNVVVEVRLEEQVVFQKQLLSKEKGHIELKAQPGRYQINLVIEEAKKIMFYLEHE